MLAGSSAVVSTINLVVQSGDPLARPRWASGPHRFPLGSEDREKALFFQLCDEEGGIMNALPSTPFVPLSLADCVSWRL